jgi:hypothetical protein
VLTDKARDWSNRMAQGGCGSGICHSHLSDNIYVDWSMLGENVGAGPNVDALVDAFAAPSEPCSAVRRPQIPTAATTCWARRARSWRTAAPLTTARRHSPFDIARDIAVMPDGKKYVVLDGWGAVHRFGSAIKKLANMPSQRRLCSAQRLGWHSPNRQRGRAVGFVAGIDQWSAMSWRAGGHYLVSSLYARVADQ